MCGSVGIPLRESDEVMEISVFELPEGQEMFGILGQKEAQLHLWLTLAIENYRQGKLEDFVSILESGLHKADSDTGYDGYKD